MNEKKKKRSPYTSQLPPLKEKRYLKSKVLESKYSSNFKIWVLVFVPNEQRNTIPITQSHVCTQFQSKDWSCHLAQPLYTANEKTEAQRG